MAAPLEQDTEEDGEPVLLWSLDERPFAVPLPLALEVTLVVALSERSGPGPQLGHLDLRGRSVPAFDARRLLGIEERQIMLSDRYLIVRAGRGRIALLVDSVEGIGTARREPVADADTGAGFGLALARIDGADARPLVHILDVDSVIPAAA